MAEHPERLVNFLRLIGRTQDRQERIQLLIDIARRYKPVAQAIASPPYAEQFKVPACESQAYVFPEPNDDGTLTFHFAVENPQGISAMAMAAILGDALSGAPLDQVAAVSTDVVYEIFGRELSMGKSMGLTGMVNLVTSFARTRLEGRI
jgi:cysteine desulfuration protein SufE